MAEWCGERGYDFVGFTHDGLQGQLGLTQAKRRLEKGAKGDAIWIFVVWTLADIARDLTSLVKTLAQLNEANILVHAQATDITLRPGDDPESKVVLALAEAHIRYVSENRKIGVRSAKAAGAQVGRPKQFTLQSARTAIEMLAAKETPKRNRKTSKRLTNAKESRLPSARDLAKEIKCGITKAAELLQEYKAELEAAETNNGES